MTPTSQKLASGLAGGMATVEPSLDNGDYLTREEFMRRYEARPDIRKAELIDNTVYLMASPVRESHSAPEALFAYLLTTYAWATPHVAARPNATVFLAKGSAAQPDWYLRIERAAGGQSFLDDDDYMAAAPELVVEVAASTISFDLHGKKDAYEKAGVREYMVWEALDHRLNCFVLANGRFEPAAADAAGIYKSRVFPGLWLDVRGFESGNQNAIKDTLAKGLASPEHATFVAELAKRVESKR